MGRKFAVEALPPEIQEQLLAQFQQYPAWTILDHTDWLQEQGYEVSKSAVHRYLKMKSEEAAEAEPLSVAEVTRLRCLEIASKHYNGNDIGDLLELSDQLLDWIRQPE
ncbi:hypothetical protein PSEWESI4_01463 [Pseudomonas carbonaria]|uniref:Uncharacterized protein n=2 Tax=Zestomonas carbonaria TaxID=2762745 RepID=A0A7U7ELH3_9GAMM|nr:hypothetical protein PSEWESI4_01463 [Pseudomonas carbonaria]